MKKAVSSIAIFALLFSGIAQEETSLVFKLADFLGAVKNYHPVALQSDLVLDMADAERLKARGGFEPKISGDFNQKEYDGKRYYQYYDMGVKIPTYLGMSVYGGYELSDGIYTNPDRTTPSNGLAYAGLEVSLLEGLFTDQRRNDLRIAKLAQKASVYQRRLIRNELLFNATKAYYDWALKWHQVDTYNQAMDLANERFRQVSQNVRVGEEAAIDTLEALLQVQARQATLNELQQQLQAAEVELTKYLWTENMEALSMNPQMRPPSIASLHALQRPNEEEFEKNKNLLDSLHPQLNLMRTQLAQFEQQNRWQREQLKPELNLKFQVLNPVGDQFQNPTGVNNYKAGVHFETPILIRKERAELQKNKLKISELEWKTTDQRQKLNVEFEQARQEQQLWYSQQNLLEQTVNNYLRLLDGERQKFQTGESNLFLVNQRELFYLNSQMKFLESLTKYQMSRAKMFLVMGQFEEVYIP